MVETSVLKCTRTESRCNHCVHDLATELATGLLTCWSLWFTPGHPVKYHFRPFTSGNLCDSNSSSFASALVLPPFNARVHNHTHNHTLMELVPQELTVFSIYLSRNSFLFRSDKSACNLSSLQGHLMCTEVLQALEWQTDSYLLL
jgi:hypothetical protein